MSTPFMLTNVNEKWIHVSFDFEPFMEPDSHGRVKDQKLLLAIERIQAYHEPIIHQESI